MNPLNVLPPIADEVPWSDHVTDYDLAHFIVYVRLLDAVAANLPEAEISELILGIESRAEPRRASRMLQSHLKRAYWMTEHGYRDLLDS